jgi:hypothetical protein
MVWGLSFIFAALAFACKRNNGRSNRHAGGEGLLAFYCGAYRDILGSGSNGGIRGQYVNASGNRNTQTTEETDGRSAAVIEVNPELLGMLEEIP